MTTKSLLLTIAIICTGIFTNAQSSHHTTNACGVTAAFTPDFSEGCAPICPIFSDSSTASSGSIVSWLWKFGDGTIATVQNPGHCYTDSGSFTVTLIVTSSKGCVDSVKSVITAYPKPVAGFTYSPDPAKPGVPVTFTDTSKTLSAITYRYWVFDTVSTSTAKNPSVTFPDTGQYEVILYVADVHGCSDSVAYSLEVTSKVAGIQDIGNNIQSFNLYPNPAETELNISFNRPTKSEMDIYDITGKVLLTKRVEGFSNIVPIDISGLPAGMYFVKISTEKKRKGAEVCKRVEVRLTTNYYVSG